ncbi:flagellar motor protein MotB [Marinobacter sp. 2_MG-2023]|uniref:flagellar motor protein MotB n=1 Tax=Marinobacter sp. 2_MG-2023 TaxID=3062679 RepID=UPI0026E2BA32|nr:flagellar motor protein MotB [Marinobacter sp. 2_MG-2023]MDO6443823.1 flagellar motor protein MotB [Marinobacter sp. 2_MG-2023]
MEQQPIIIKRKKVVAGGHHGGSWKVAFADFATAMMAFFLVLWLTATASPEQKKAVEGYFRDPVGFTDGGSPNPVDLEGSASVINEASMDVDPGQIAISENVVDALSDTLEQRRMNELFEELKQRIDENETLQEFKDQLLIDITDEGLRIQIVDRSGRPMFDIGKAELKYYSQDILFELAKTLGSVDNRVSITGHTDATPFGGRPGYTNWELSADRANTARRALVAGGVRAQQIARVVGLSDSVLFDQSEPTAPINRRISIIVLNKKTVNSIQSSASAEGVPLIDVTAPSEQEQEKAQESLQSGDWLDENPEPAPGELNW